jgi:hypothetical protein
LATIKEATSSGDSNGGNLRDVTDDLRDAGESGERRLQLALEAKDIEEVHAALREMTRLQCRRTG